MIRTPAVERLIGVAKALADLPEAFIFVGGSVLGLLVTEVQSPTPRATDDVDIVALVSDYAQHAQLAEHLRARGFTEDSESHVICRWRFRGWIVDVMPPDPNILGFSNELYPSAMANAAVVVIDGMSIRHIDASHFIGTKLLAYEGRGKGDMMASHDLEDLFAVFNTRPETVSEIVAAPVDCQRVILPRLQAIRSNRDFEEVLEAHLANDVPGQSNIVTTRIDEVLTLAQG